MKLDKLILITSILLLLIFQANSKTTEGQTTKKQPNFIIIFCDDLGYGDLGTFGHPTIQTPSLDKMASEGQKWTSFYVASSVCTPSRAGILTGRYPIRSGMCSDKHRVLFPDSDGGLPASEITIAEALKTGGYSTACIGKWHLGHKKQYLPTNNGFDYYFGIPYSNDMDMVKGKPYQETCKLARVEDFNPPLMRNSEIIERPAQQATITKRYTEEAIHFIENNSEKPFFIYLAHSLPHVPLFRSKKFEGKSIRGLYGDVIEEIDWSVGQILNSLKENGLDENTLVVFTSDNGPWLMFEDHGGSAGLLRDGKGSTFEGGMREPTIFLWKNQLHSGVVSDMGSTLDLLPTFCSLAGVELPKDRIYDGNNLSTTLLKGKISPRNEMIYYRGQKIYAARKGAFKAHFITKSAYGGEDEKVHETPLLYNLDVDPSEKYNLAKEHPEIIKEIWQLVEVHKKSVIPVKDQLEERGL
ncbi:MAG: sulfatase [Mariniphaga sp.]|nr:sulfatase [Mariniphaga sp.]